MYYCWACHAHGICNGCWSSLILSNGSSGRGQRKKQCRNGGKVTLGNLFDTEGLEDEDIIGCISISSGHTGEETEEDAAQETKQVITMKCQSCRWIRTSLL
jgi:hypothetical protein